MTRWIRNLLTPPVFADEAKTALTRRVYQVLHAVIVLSGAFCIPFALFPEVLSSRFTTIAAFIIPSAIVLLELTRRGWASLASYSLLFLLWLVVTVGAATGGGVSAPIFMGYLVIIVAAGLLMGGRAITLASVFSLVSGFGLAYAQTHEMLPARNITYTPYSAFLIYAFFSLSVLILQNMNWKTLQATLTDLQNELRERKRVENTLKQRAHEQSLLYQVSKALTGGENLLHLPRPARPAARHSQLRANPCRRSRPAAHS